MHDSAAPSSHQATKAALTLGALGVVFGDIGTSPLYSMREALEHNGLEPTADHIYGILSLITWSLVVIVTIKYLMFVMRADNDGEGGILALTSLLRSASRDQNSAWTKRLVAIGLFGTALLYGDGIITPAISVVSAVEGIGVIAPSATRFVVPVSTIILIVLFAVQRKGTAAVGKLFGPIMIVWFAVLALLGAGHVAQHPGVFQAANPLWALRFLLHNGSTGLLAMGAVFLCVTGGEALYADMGHFGRSPIARAWLFVAFPALLVNYYGQGALLLEHPEEIENPFFGMAPHWALVPLLVLATCATVIASQALISGAFSLTAQAVKLGYLPRMNILHTSNTEAGQVYCPAVNWALMVGSIAVVWAFRTSAAIASAYGMAVTLTMLVTTMLFVVLMRSRGWPAWKTTVLGVAFGSLELLYFAGNVPKIPHGGWVALVVGFLLYFVMHVWSVGKNAVRQALAEQAETLEAFVKNIDDVPRTPGVAVYMSSVPKIVPPALHMNSRFHGTLHETVLVVRVATADSPHVDDAQRVESADLGDGVTSVLLTFGWAEEIDVPHALRSNCGVEDPVWFIGRESVVVTPVKTMSPLGEHLYSRMQRNETTASQFFGLPMDHTMEVGAQVGI